MDTQEAHCDDIAFAAVVTYTTKKPLVYVQSKNGKPLMAKDLGFKLARGLGLQPHRSKKRAQCSGWILQFLHNHTMPLVKKHTC